ncbi:hypothetical protein FRC14_006934 [Serendipita sp. 396]|nr:hypothetical protein FRC14_006934 [Serendipita sp. 396]
MLSRNTDMDQAAAGAQDGNNINNNNTTTISKGAQDINASLPSFVELMASLGLQDEHSAHALLRGASLGHLDDEQPSNNFLSESSKSSSQTTTSQEPEPPTPTLEVTSSVSLGTPLSSASLLTPLSSPMSQRDHRNSHGKKRYSPYGLGAPNVGNNTEYRDIYTRRSSVPGLPTETMDSIQDKRQMHHFSAPIQSDQFRFPQRDRQHRDGDGDEMMQDAGVSSSLQREQSRETHLPTLLPASRPSQLQSHCIGQPNLLISSRQRNVRGTLGPRTKSQTHMRTTSTHSRDNSTVPVVPPLPSSLQGHMNTSPYSSASRRSGRAMAAANANVNASASGVPTGSFIDIGTAFDGEVDVSNSATVVSISSLLRRSQPSMGGLTVSLGGEKGTVPPSPTTRKPVSIQAAPPSAPPTKTVFGFGPGISLSGRDPVSSNGGAVRRARHARSSSARSVRDMIRERDPSVPSVPLHSFLPLTEELSSAAPIQHPVRRKIQLLDNEVSVEGGNNSQVPSASTPNLPPAVMPAPSNTAPQTNLATSSFLSLDDPSRSFSYRRRAKKQANRSSPPPPLMLLPTLPHNFSIKSLVDTRQRSQSEEEEGKGDRLSAPDGYVSRREPHSPGLDAKSRSSWRSRRSSPPTPSAPNMRCSAPVGVTSSVPVMES